MQKAIMKAYSGLIPDGFTPSWFIYLETNQDRIDINIHPSKTEVKFEEESAVFEILHSAVKESLGNNKRRGYS
jgi:DNA mismatch repair protein MutL